MSKINPLDILKHHVTGAIERGEKQAIEAVTTQQLKHVRIYDNGGKTLDRYTAIYMNQPEYQPKTYSARGMSSYPFSPHGFGCSTIATPGRHLGKRISFAELPPDCQKLVLQDTAVQYETI
jgi:hypothetical protein